MPERFKLEVEAMKCKSRDCENEVEQDKAVCPSCIEKIFSSFGQAQSAEVVQKRREGVVEIVVRHALKDPDWRRKCAGLISHNQITEEEVQEAARLRGGTVKGSSVPVSPVAPQSGWENMASFLPCSSETEKKLLEISTALKQTSVNPPTEPAKIKEELAKLIEQLDLLLKMVQGDTQEREELVKQLRLEREWNSQPRQQPIKPAEPAVDPFRIDWKSNSGPAI
jgi:hypothetical protein